MGRKQQGVMGRAFIIGTDRNGVCIAKQLLADPTLGLYPVGFIYQNDEYPNQEFTDLPIVGSPSMIECLVEEMDIDHLIIALSPEDSPNYYRVMEECLKTKAKIWKLPLFRSIDTGKLVQCSFNIHEEELLGRNLIDFEMKEMEKTVQGKIVLVTGAGGSIGSELCRNLVRLQPKTLILLGRGENSIYSIEMELRGWSGIHGPKIVPVIANIQEKEKMEEIMATFKPDIVYHTAAHKHVPLMEIYPEEALKNNVIGTKNVALASFHHGVETFVLISTDKAVKPTSVMGASKRMAEMLIQHLNEKNKTKFISVRFGNVLGSRGSIIPLFKQQIEKGGPLTVTHPEMDRYFMTIPEAVRLVIQAGSLGSGGEIFVLDMGKPIKVVELARKMIKLSGHTVEEIGIVFTGIRPGEKLHEELLDDTESESKRIHPKILMGKSSIFNIEKIEHLLVHYQSYTKEQLREKMLDIANNRTEKRSQLISTG